MTDIYHAGIKGQKKGVRRFQYKNGTYTREGNLRYRPPKGEKIVRRAIKGVCLGELAIMAIDSSGKSSAAISAIKKVAKVAIEHLTGDKVSLGKKIVDIVLKVPAPIRAITLPFIAAGAAYGITNLVLNHEAVIDKIKELPIRKVVNTTISIGTTAAGTALSAVSANPLPAVAGITLGTLITSMERNEDYY